ncbi:hypothetical protein IMCC21224_112634 [Puniceibacterium sp. IMCC21224]|nr:hypothetical protein IMCC21224_112634 [Puniceibacterium sp. IMCC21224]
MLGLLAGLALPELAAAMRPWLPHLVALLLFMTALRVGARAALGGLGQARVSLGFVLVLQVALPLLALGILAALDLLAWPLATAVVLMLAAPSVTGSPNFAIMTGHDPAPAMRLLVLGTALFPLTALPVLWLLPQLGGIEAAVQAALRLIVVTLAAVALGFAARRWLLPHPSDAQSRALDGANALALAVIVVGLMSAIGPLARSDPQRLAWWMAAVVAVNFGLQIAGFVVLRRLPGLRSWTVPVSIIAGNRNIALFLIALPPDVTAPLLIFIGCYQVPMYLTPILLKKLHDTARV